jgi:hypothetical protein
MLFAVDKHKHCWQRLEASGRAGSDYILPGPTRASEGQMHQQLPASVPSLVLCGIEANDGSGQMTGRWGALDGDPGRPPEACHSRSSASPTTDVPSRARERRKRARGKRVLRVLRELIAAGEVQ